MSNPSSASTAESIIQSAHEAIIGTDLGGAIATWNFGATRLFGYTEADALQQSIGILIPADRWIERMRILDVIACGTVFEKLDTVGVRKNASQLNLSLSITPIFDSRNEGKSVDRSAAPNHSATAIKQPSGACVIARDITREKQNEARLRHCEAIIRFSNDAIIGKSLDGIVTTWNAGAERLFGYREHEIVGRPLASIIPPENHEEEAQIIERIARGEPIDHIETVRIRKDGMRIDISATVSPIVNELGHVIGASTIARDITVQKMQAAIMNDMAYRDPLTNLANRRFLLDRIRRTMLLEDRTHRHGALLYVDLDNFKHVNDRGGHGAGDRLLEAVARRIEAAVREKDTVARVGGDEFAVLLDGLSADRDIAAGEAERISLKIIEALRQPHTMSDLSFDSTPSIGIALFRGTELSVDELLKRADAAMYQAKQSGKNRFLLGDVT